MLELAVGHIHYRPNVTQMCPYRLELELQKQQSRIEKLVDPRYSTGKDAAQTRREIEKHVVMQQLKKQVSRLSLAVREHPDWMDCR